MTTPLGPRDRTTFFEEQARHRRRTLRFTLVSGVAVALTGIPVSLVVSPILFLLTLLVAHLIELAAPLPPWFWQLVDQAGRLAPALVNQADRAFQTGDWSAIDLRSAALLGAGAIVPGMALTVLVWLWVRTLLGTAGVGGMLARIGARAPRLDDLEERQLANLVDEMAIAGGLRRPRLMLLDRDEPNAAAIGRGPEDATIVVTRGLLAQLDRDETQGVIGHLVGSVGNGDLGIAWRLLAVFQTYTLLAVVLQAPSARLARRTVWRAVRGLFRRDRAELEQLAELLASDDPARAVGDAAEPRTPLGLLRLPLIVVALTVQLVAVLGAMLVFGPALGALWRARRYLADATAVQLTRHPDGLANALRKLANAGAFAAGSSSQLLFVVWGGLASGGQPGPDIPGGLHPTIARRVKRLEAAGARRIPIRAPSWSFRWWTPLLALLMAVAYTVFGVSIVAMVGMAVVVTALSLLMTAIAIAFIHWFFEVLPHLPQIAREAARVIGDLVRLIRASRP